MTTWAFNVVRELLAGHVPQTVWLEPGNEVSEKKFTESDGPVIAKCHHFSAALAELADVIIYSYRDLRTAAVSYHRKFDSPCTRDQLTGWTESGRMWLPKADLILRYESVERQPMVAVSRIRKLIDEKFGRDTSATIGDAEILALVDGEFVERQTPKEISYDSNTMILPGHRTYQPSPQELPASEKAIYDRIENEFSVWLADYGYVQSENYGQELEYQIASSLLKYLGSPTVLDVGVEKGSFTKLAIEAGAKRVIGFEPLPRHLRFLAQKYGGVYEVEIHPFAVSSASGKASFHVATDLEGNELDYHHTLSDLGNSATVIRDQNVLEVTTVSLSDFLRTAKLDSEVDFLKIDTDGHDLEVLRGLGDIRPKVILAEYWDNLPETSGANIYGLSDLGEWARTHGYSTTIVIRRHGPLELVELNSLWTIAGDWGNVFFFHDNFGIAGEVISQLFCRFSKAAHEKLCADFARLQGECVAKEAEIRHLAAAVKAFQENPADGHQDASSTSTATRAETLMIQVVQKEAVIREQHRAAQAFYAAFLLLTPLTYLGRFVRFVLGRKVKTDVSNPAADEATVSVGVAPPSPSPATPSAPTQIQVAVRENSSDSISQLLKDLEEKEQKIQEQRRALQAFRVVAMVLAPILVPMNFIARHLKAALRPRLGDLNQYPPRPMELPSSYSRPISLKNPPKISLVTPSFNQALFIERTLKSVFDQSYPDLEYFVQDGGSQDETPAILARYSNQLSGWTSAPDGGQSHAINTAFARTSGDIMAWLNSDDMLLPGALAYVGDYFARHPDVDVVYGSRVLVDEADMEIGRWILPPHNNDVMPWADFVPQETLFWRRSIWERAGGRIDESFRFAMDWDLLLRFRDVGARMVCLPRILGAFRIHEAQKTSASINNIGMGEMDRLRERHLGRRVSENEIRKALIPYMLSHIWCEIFHRLRRRLALS